MDERPVCEQRRYSIVGVPRSSRSLPGQSVSRRPRRGSRAQLDNLSGNDWRLHVSPAKRGAPPVVCASHALGRDQWCLQLSQREFPDLGVDFLPLRLHPAAARAAFYAALAWLVRRRHPRMLRLQSRAASHAPTCGQNCFCAPPLTIMPTCPAGKVRLRLSSLPTKSISGRLDAGNTTSSNSPIALSSGQTIFPSSTRSPPTLNSPFLRRFF